MCSFRIDCAREISCAPQTLHEWVRKHEIDTGMRDGVSSEEGQQIKTLAREVRELRRAKKF